MSAALYNPSWYAGNKDATGRSAAVIAPYVASLVEPSSILDLGCGTGSWLAAFGVGDCIGCDGPWVDPGQLEIPPERFLVHDLSQPLRLDRRFDLAVSIEVAEHLPESASATLVESLTAHAPVVLFSAAVPGQPGAGHVNDHWPDYWATLFADRNYAACDVIRLRFWEHPDVRYFHAQNIILYVQRDRLDDLEIDETPVPRLIHPRLYASALERFPQPESVRLRPALGFLARMLRIR